MEPRTHRATVALGRLRNGDQNAAQELFDLVYDDLRELAQSLMRHERSGHTLQATALVHEAYMRLFNEGQAEWQNRAHFLGVAARGIRQILVDHSRKRAAVKRGANPERVTTNEAPDWEQGAEFDLLELDDAMKRLSALDERQARVVELRFFGGLSVAEAAEVLAVSERTVKSDWQVARLWLHRELAS